jgi:hypothetical protein
MKRYNLVPTNLDALDAVDANIAPSDDGKWVRHMVKSLEWIIYPQDLACPTCLQYPAHADDCRLAALLAKVEGELVDELRRRGEESGK